MKLILKNNTYVDPATGEVFENVELVDYDYADNRHKEELNISFALMQSYKVEELNFESNELEEVEKRRVIAKTALKFSSATYKPTYITVDGNMVDFFAWLGEGNSYAGQALEIGVPDYQSVRGYFTKDDIGLSVEINPDLDEIGRVLVEKFALECIKINGEAVGNQFQFPK